MLRNSILETGVAMPVILHFPHHGAKLTSLAIRFLRFESLKESLMWVKLFLRLGEACWRNEIAGKVNESVVILKSNSFVDLLCCSVYIYVGSSFKNQIKHMNQSESEQLWLKFEKSFKDNLEYFQNLSSLHEFLRNKTEMTKFYKEKLFQRIADNMELNLSEKEYLRVDMTMYKIGANKYHVPFIFIESENDPDGDIANEIKKLLHLNAPLKILITRGSFEHDILNNDTDWGYVIEDFAEYNRMIGYFVFISASWDNNKLKYQYIAYKDNGEQYSNLQTIFLKH